VSEKPQPFVWRGMTVGLTTSGGETGPVEGHAVRIEVGDEVVYKLADVGGGNFGVVRSASREVRQHYRELDRARKAVAYRKRRVKSLLPDAPAEPKPAPDAPCDEIGRPMTACPACIDGGVTACGLCDQTGWVTLGQADCWRDEHDRGDA
jgi:hypothetical protein